ncbi:MAG: VanZ family protein [Prevotellaceae bacterium]|jgi:VanZ family protein|nr:VanZ family protein [Prevotellaceae bacterium]
MLHYLKRYPISLLIILTVIYLSFFHPPRTELDTIRNFDKLVHIGMYLGMSGMLWLEFLLAHRRNAAPIWHVFIGAMICPILFSGMVEILQSTLTTYRSGDWLDFAANSLGVCIASLIGYFVLRPWVLRKA